MLIIALVLAGVVLVFVTYRFNEVNDYITAERDSLQNDLGQIIESYDIISNQNDSLGFILDKQRDRINSLRDSVKYLGTTLSLLKRYRNQVRVLKEQNKYWIRKADTLNRLNQLLISERDSLGSRLDKQVEKTAVLEQRNEKLSKTVRKGQAIRMSNIYAEAIIINDDGSLENTTRSRRVDKLKICATLNENPLAQSGMHNVYVIVATPQEILLGSQLKEDRRFIADGEQKLFSAKSKVNYENEQIDICVFVSGSREEFVKGNYLCAMYLDDRFIGEAEIRLN